MEAIKYQLYKDTNAPQLVHRVPAIPLKISAHCRGRGYVWNRQGDSKVYKYTKDQAKQQSQV